MAFNLKLVLKALLFSSSQPLTIKDIQVVFGRYHDQAQASLVPTEGEGADGEAPVTPADARAETTAENESGAPTGGAPVENAPASADVRADAPASTPESAASAESAASIPAADEPAELATTADETNPLGLTPVDAELYADVPSLVTAAQIREAMDELAAELKAQNDIYLLIDGANGYRLVTHPRFAKWIRVLRDEPPPVKLTQSAIETLAVVAYRQPVTRSEIESIRGVSSENVLSKLMERDLVYIVGRADLPGRPLQYGTTDKFLEFVGVKSLVELPASDVLSPRQIDEWLNRSANVTPPADAEMGLPLEEGEGESPSLEPVQIEHVEPSDEAASLASSSPTSPLSDLADAQADEEASIEGDVPAAPSSPSAFSEPAADIAPDADASSSHEDDDKPGSAA